MLQDIASLKSVVQALQGLHSTIQALPAANDDAGDQAEEQIATVSVGHSNTDQQMSGEQALQFRCELCQDAFPTQRALRVHQWCKHRAKADSAVFDKQRHSLEGLPICRFCHQKFSRWSGLERHIVNRRCTKIPIETVAADEVIDMEKPRADPNITDSIPVILRSCMSTMAGNPAAIHGMPEIAEHLLHHCGVCNQWLVSPGLMKQHYRYSHKKEFEVLQSQCESLLKSWFTPSPRCSLCADASKGWKRHKCTVAWQVSALCSLVKAGYHGGSDGSNHGDVRHGKSQSNSTQTRVPGLADSRSSVKVPQSQGQGQGKKRRLRTKSTPARLFWSPSPIPPEPIYNHASNNINDGSRAVGAVHAGPTCSSGSACAAGRQRGPSLEAGLQLCSMDAPRRTYSTTNDVQHGQGVEGQDHEYRCEGDSHAAYNASCRDSSGGDQPSRASDRGCRQSPQTSRSGVERCEHGLAISKVGCGVQDARDGVGTGSTQGYGNPPAPRRIEAEAPGSDGHAIPLNTTIDVRHERIGHVLARDQPEIQGSTTRVGTSTCSHGFVGVAADCSSIQTRGLEEIDLEQDGTRILGTVPQLILSNPTNLCYMHALIQCLSWCVARAFHPVWCTGFGRGERAWRLLLTKTGQHVHIYHMMLWKILLFNWSYPDRQHDVCEFFSFLSSRIQVPWLCGIWHARSPNAGLPATVMEVGDSGSEAITLWFHGCSLRESHIAHSSHSAYSLQSMLDRWGQQTHRCAFVQPPHVLALRLERAVQSEQMGVVKHEFRCSLEHPRLQIPQFINDQTDVRHCSYEIVGGICHHGRTYSSGHYQAFLYAPARGVWICDDDRPAVFHMRAPEWLERKVYMIFARRSGE